MSGMDFAFDTQRLRVFEASVTPWSDRPTSTLYVAFLKEPGPAQSVGHAIVTDQRTKSPAPWLPLYCELVEVSVMFRGKGYGPELFLGIEGWLGAKMAAIAATPEGKQFLTKLNRPTDSLAVGMEPMFAPFLKAPGVETRLQEEEKMLGALPPPQNPAHQDFQGDAFQTFAAVAPLTTVKGIITASEMPLQERLLALQRLLQILCGGGSQGGASATAGI